MDDMSIVNRLTLKASSLIHNSKHSAVNSNIISAVRMGIREEEASDITVLEKNRITQYEYRDIVVTGKNSERD